MLRKASALKRIVVRYGPQNAVGPITSLWPAYKLSCGRAIIYCGLAINNPVVSEVKSEIRSSDCVIINNNTNNRS